MTIGQRMKEQRKALKMSADELAKRLGKDRSTVYRYEKGDIENLPLDMLEPIAEALEMSPQQLMGWEQSETEEINKKNSDAIADITNRLFSDSKFFSMINSLHNLNAEQFERAEGLLNLFFKETF